MAGEDATIRIGADGSAFTKAVQAMAKNTDTMANSITARLARLGQAFNGVTAAGRMVGNAISGFTGPAAEVEDAAAALEVMLENDAEAARRLADALQMLAVNGKVGMEDLYGAARALSNVYQDAGHIERWVGVFADISAGSKLSAARLGEFVAKLHDSGKADFNELANAGIPIFEVLGEITGKNAQELARMGQAGEISAGMVLDAFARMTAAGGKYHALNSKLSNTTRGSWETLRGTISACAGVLGAPINDAIRPILQEVAGLLQDMRPQIAECGQLFGSVFRGVLTVAQPVISAMAFLAEKVLKVSNVIGLAVAGFVVYAAHANRAAAATWTFSGAVGGMAVRLKGLKLWSVFTSWGGACAAARRTWSGFCSFMTLSWKSACITIANTFKMAWRGIKAALIASGIGALIWGITEGCTALYNYIAGVDEKAKEAAESAKAFSREMRDMKKRVAEVRTEADMAAVLEQAERRVVELGDEIIDAIDEKNEKQTAALRRQREELQRWIPLAKKEMELAVAKEKKAVAAREAMEEERRLAEEALKAEQERLKTIKQMAAAREDSSFERMVDRMRASGGDPAKMGQDIIKMRLRRVGVRDVEALEKEIERLENMWHPTQEQLDRYQLLVGVWDKIKEEERRMEEHARGLENEKTERRRNYADRRHTYEENKEEDRYKGMSVAQQERELERRARAAGYYGPMSAKGIRGKLDALADAGAKENEDAIAELERILEMYGELVERKRELARLKVTNMQELRIQALEAVGNHEGADKLREKMTRDKRVQELREAGYSEAAAKKQAGKEAKVRQASALAEKLQNSRVEWVKTSLASVGGGVARRLGDGQLAEAKKHSALLKDIKDILTGTNGPYAILS